MHTADISAEYTADISAALTADISAVYTAETASIPESNQRIREPIFYIFRITVLLGPISEFVS